MTDQPKPPGLNDLMRALASKHRVQVLPGATNADTMAAIREGMAARDVGEVSGPTRVVRGEQVTTSDLLRGLARGDYGDDPADRGGGA